ncbi:MAG: MFS transporter [Gemmatimonadota bacterium]|nr:MFS transporter [Gemmatimonadota bacterium]
MALTTEPTVRESRRPPKRWPFSFPDSRLNPWRGLGGLPREVWLLFATNLINRAGMMVLPFLVLYLTRELGFSPARAGAMLAVYGASAIVFGPIGGRLSDRIGALRVMRVSLIASGSVLLLFPVAKGFASVAAMTVLWAGCAEMFRPASLAAITHVVVPEQRRQAFALNRLAINLGMSMGPALGGFLATVSFRAMFTVDAVTTLLAGAVLTLAPWRAFSGVNSEATTRDSEAIGPATIFHDTFFLVFLGGVFLVGIVFFQHESALPFYLVQYLQLSPAFYGLLFTINTLLIVALEVPLNTATAHWSNTRLLVLGCLLFAVGFGALGVIASPAGVIGTVVVWTFGEMLLFPAMSAHMAEVAPENRRGAYMGAYSMSLSLALTVGPWMGTQLLAVFGPFTVWSVMFALGALAGLLMAYAAPRARPPLAAAAAGS